MEGLKNVELENPLTKLNELLWGFEENAKSSADNGGQGCDVLARSWTVL